MDFSKKEAQALLDWMRKQMYGNTVTEWLYVIWLDNSFHCAYNLLQSSKNSFLLSGSNRFEYVLK